MEFTIGYFVGSVVAYLVLEMLRYKRLSGVLYLTNVIKEGHMRAKIQFIKSYDKIK